MRVGKTITVHRGDVEKGTVQFGSVLQWAPRGAHMDTQQALQYDVHYKVVQWDAQHEVGQKGTVSVLGQDSGYRVKYNPLPDGGGQRVIFDRISQIES